MIKSNDFAHRMVKKKSSPPESHSRGASGYIKELCTDTGIIARGANTHV